MSKSISVLILIFAFILLLFGCGEKQKNSVSLSAKQTESSKEFTESKTEPDSTVSKTEKNNVTTEAVIPKNTEEENHEYNEKVMEMRERILEEAPGAMAGVAFLGYIDGKSDDIWEKMESDGYDEFAEEIPDDKIIKYSSQGGEAWCIVPADERSEASIKILSADTDKDNTYICKNGEPFIIICDETADIELTVKIGDRTSNQLLEIDTEFADLYDFTVKNIEPTYPEMPEGYDIITMVLDYYERNYYYRPKYADVYENRDGSSTVRLYDSTDDNTATSAWYEVYENSCMGRDMMLNEEINFLE